MSTTATFDALMSIYQSHGTITPALVVAESVDPLAPLHDRFEWDDAKAAQRDRETTAARLIRQVHVTRITDSQRGPVRVRAFLPIDLTDEDEDTDGPTPWTYAAIDDLSSRAVSAILAQMEKDVASLRRKYRDHRAALDQMLRTALAEAG